VTAGLILAAGESRRMGSPKALLDYRGETFLDRLIGLFSLHCQPVVAVLGAGRESIRAGLLRGAEALIVENPDYRLGQLSSMQCGLRAVSPGSDGVLFTLVDHPAVEPATLVRLLEPATMAPLRVPRYGGRRGHPIWICASLIPEFLALPTTAAAREVVARHAHESAYIDVDDPGVVMDIDDPQSYQRLSGNLA